MQLQFSPNPWLRRIFAGWLVLGALIMTTQPATLQGMPPRDFAALLNQARQAEGLAPLGWSTLLAQAAQRHADDLAAHNLIDTTGSDGSTYRQRIRETGYRAWNDGLLVHETFWVGLGNAANAMTWFRNEAHEWDTFVDPRYREIGVGYAESQNIHYFVISLGSRPGVLPVFINEGAEATAYPQIVIRLTNEEAVPLGEGRWIGKAIEVRIGETPNLEDAPWQPWEPLLPWVLSTNTPNDYAIYVEYRDGAGRTAISQDTIRLAAAGEEDIPPTIPHQEVPLPSVDPNGDLNNGEEATATPGSEAPLTPATPTAPESPTPFIEATAPVVPAMTEPTLSAPITATPTSALASERHPADWLLISILLLQGIALLLGVAAFLRRK